MGRLRVGIECRIDNFQQGVGTAILSLARDLCGNPGEAEHYTFIIFEDHRDLFSDLPPDRGTIMALPRPALRSIKKSLSRITPLRNCWRLARATLSSLPLSDGTVEREGFDVVHFPTQVGYLTKIPFIYQPWDLQHVHLPQFFSLDERISRNRVYKALCQRARFVSVQTEWGKNDLVCQYGIEANKIEVIPWGSVLNAYPRPEEPDIEATRKKYRLPSQFLFFPAVTWAHKNHELAIRALNELRKLGEDISLVCTGNRTERYPFLEALARKCNVADRVRFLGFVNPVELQAIYSLATAMIFPSRFEGFGLPVLEAFHSGLPVLCARATVLPEVAGDAALFFDPDDPQEAAQAIRSLIASPGLRAQMVQRGYARASVMTVNRAAEQLRDLYRRAAGIATPALQTASMPQFGREH
jgi:glycosyltransferase involved in cell wall biosynthesis